MQHDSTGCHTVLKHSKNDESRDRSCPPPTNKGRIVHTDNVFINTSGLNAAAESL